MKRLVFFALFAIVTLDMSAQITFAEPVIQQTEKQGWEFMRDIMLLPYDSTQLVVYFYPTLEAYKKYIGQKLFVTDEFHGHIIYKNKVEGDKYKLRYLVRGDTMVVHKYFEIIDVVSIVKSNFYDRTLSLYKYDDNNEFSYINEKNEKTKCYVIADSIPCFVLKNIQNSDTVFLAMDRRNHGKNIWGDGKEDRGYILVGGFVKLKEKTVGQKIVYYEQEASSAPEIKSAWKCIDVSIASNDCIGDYWDDSSNNNNTFKDTERVSFVLQNIKDPSIVRNLSVEKIQEYTLRPPSHGIIFEKTFRDAELAYNKQKQQAKQEQAKQEQQIAQEKAKRKQQLTAKYGATVADQIMAGKYEIGMSKAVCKEIAGYTPSVVEKTATEEIWLISNYFFGGKTYLHFVGDKLARIVRY